MSTEKELPEMMHVKKEIEYPEMVNASSDGTGHFVTVKSGQGIVSQIYLSNDVWRQLKEIIDGRI